MLAWTGNRQGHDARDLLQLTQRKNEHTWIGTWHDESEEIPTLALRRMAATTPGFLSSRTSLQILLDADTQRCTSAVRLAYSHRDLKGSVP